MNREQKAAVIDEIAADISQSQAIFAVDYRGITVAQVAELRAKLRESDATFKVVKNSLTERAADQSGAEALKDYLAGPTALTCVRGDVATAAKAVADYARATQLLPFKGGLMEGAPIDVDQIRSLSRLPSREVLYGQLVGVVASPIGGLVRSLGGLIGGLAVALGQVNAKKESGELPAGDAPVAEAAAPAEEPAAAADEPQADAPAAEAEPAADEPPSEEPAAEEPAAEEPAAEAEPETQTEPEPSIPEDRQNEPAQADDNPADVSAENQPEDAETNPPKED
jgi:large subunit ribosomal protein L10